MTNAPLVTSIRVLRAQLLCEGFFQNCRCRMQPHQIQCSDKKTHQFQSIFSIYSRSVPDLSGPAVTFLVTAQVRPFSCTVQFGVKAHTQKYNPSQDLLVTDWPILPAAFPNLLSPVLLLFSPP